MDGPPIIPERDKDRDGLIDRFPVLISLP